MMTKPNIQFEEAANRIEDFLDELGLDYTFKNNKYIAMPCPIHGGDNPAGLIFYYDGNYGRGKWLCYTHNCHNKYRSDIVGFLQGYLAAHKNHKYKSYNKLISHVLKNKPKTNRPERTTESNKIKPVSRDRVIANLQIPSQYYLDRGYSKEILIKYDVGDCIHNGKPMSHRAVFPLYNSNQEMIGCTGRTKFKQCNLCKLYHSQNFPCPEKKYAARYSKWRHQTGFDGNCYLYNLDNVVKQNKQKIILVESPGNVLRLEESGVHISSATFGAKFSLAQRELLDKTDISTIITIGDRDAAGDNYYNIVKSIAEPLYNVVRLEPLGQDIGEMSIDEIKGWKALWELINE